MEFLHAWKWFFFHSLRSRLLCRTLAVSSASRVPPMTIVGRVEEVVKHVRWMLCFQNGALRLLLLLGQTGITTGNAAFLSLSPSVHQMGTVHASATQWSVGINCNLHECKTINNVRRKTERKTRTVLVIFNRSTGTEPETEPAKRSP